MNIIILQPSRGQSSNAQRLMLHRLQSMLFKRGGQLAFSDDNTAGMLGHSRAILLARLAGLGARTRSGAPSRVHRGLWLDADTTLDPARVIEMAERPEDVIMWNYPVRIAFDVNYPPEKHIDLARTVRQMVTRMWTGVPRMDAGSLTRSEDGQLVEMTQAGFGATLMSPNVAVKMIEVYGSTTDWGDSPLSLAFDPWPPPHKRSSEDISFWRRFTHAGGRLWCDPQPYVTNGESGGCFADEIAKTEALGQSIAMAWATAPA